MSDDTKTIDEHLEELDLDQVVKQGYWDGQRYVAPDEPTFRCDELPTGKGQA